MTASVADTFLHFRLLYFYFIDTRKQCGRRRRYLQVLYIVELVLPLTALVYWSVNRIIGIREAEWYMYSHVKSPRQGEELSAGAVNGWGHEGSAVIGTYVT